MSMSHKKQKGFTLVELLVSMGLFSIVMMISIGTLLSIVDANKKARSLIAVTTEMNFLFDSMMRTIRTGYAYDCGGTGDCPNGGPILNLYNKDGDPVQYSFNKALGTIERTVDGSNPPDRLTSSVVSIKNMSFIVTGTTEGDGEQPTVTVMVQAAAGVDAETSTRFNLQATVTQRVLDL